MPIRLILLLRMEEGRILLVERLFWINCWPCIDNYNQNNEMVTNIYIPT